jgi:hypothetical protein
MKYYIHEETLPFQTTILVNMNSIISNNLLIRSATSEHSIYNNYGKKTQHTTPSSQNTEPTIQQMKFTVKRNSSKDMT